MSDKKSAKLLLVLIIAARATSFCFSKVCLRSMAGHSLLALRFSLAFVLLALIFHRRLIRDFSFSDLLKGVCFGLLYFAVMSCEYAGLRDTPSSTVSFIENMAIVIVPFLNIPVQHRLPSMKNVLCALTALAGIGLLTLKDGFALSRGELYILGAAFFYASAIVVTNLLSKSGSTLNMGIYQVGTIAVLSLVCSGASGTLALPVSGKEYLCVLALALVCTGFGYTLQPVVQSRLSAEETGIFCAVNPMVAGFIGVVFLRESFGPLKLLGALLILISLALNSLELPRRGKKLPGIAKPLHARQ